jgi:hypothetical protein
MAKTEGFNLKEDLKDDYDVNDLEMGTLAQVLRPLIDSISISIGLFFFESIVTSNNLDVKTEIA